MYTNVYLVCLWFKHVTVWEHAPLYTQAGLKKGLDSITFSLSVLFPWDGVFHWIENSIFAKLTAHWVSEIWSYKCSPPFLTFCMDAEDLSSFCHACRVNILTHWTISPTAHQVSLIHHYHIGNMWSTIFSFQLLYLSMNLHWNTTPTFIYVCAIPFLQPTQHSSFKTSGYFHFFIN